MGKWDLIALTTNALIASAIYFMPGTISGLTGAWSPWVHVAAVLVTLAFILPLAEAASRFREAGGPYLYAYAAFGPFVGFEIGWIAYLTRLAATAANYNLFVIYFGFFFPSASGGITRALVLLVLIAVLTIVNIRGVRYGAWAVDLIMIVKMLPLLILIFGGIFFVRTENLTPGVLPPAENILRSIFLLSFAYGGFEIVTIPSGESLDPQRHIPRALMIALGVALFMFTAIQIVGAGTFPAFAASERPIGTLAEHLFPAFGASLVALGALVSTFGYFGGSILSVPRLTYALGENGQLPRMFTSLHPRYNTPYVSIIFYSAVTYMLAVSSNFITLAAVSVVSRLLFYISTSAAVLRFRRQSAAPFVIPFGPFIPLLGIALAIVLLAYTKPSEMYTTLGGIGVGTLLYIAMRKSHGTTA